MSEIVHEKAAEVLWSEDRFKFLLVGRRGGKTTTFVEDCMKSVPICPPGGEIYFIGPSNQHALELYWDPVRDRLEELGYLFKPLISKQHFRLTKNRKIFIIGGEKIRRIRGKKVFRAYLDEIAYYDTKLKEVWKAVRPALSDLKGNASVATTPNGKGTDAYEFYLECMKDGKWGFYTWNTTDNPFIDQSEIEEARQTLDEKSFRQEYEATWEAFEGLAYYNFNEATHMRQCKEFTYRSGYLEMMFDFNVNPTTLLVGEYEASHAKIRREYSLRDGSTIKTVEQFCMDFEADKSKFVINIYGDASGGGRKSTTGRSDYEYVKEVLTKYGFNFKMNVPAKNPNPLDRVNYVNGWLRNVHGESRIEIDPSCRELILDLSSQELDGRYPSDKGNRGHKADALGYFIWWKSLVGESKGSTTIQM